MRWARRGSDRPQVEISEKRGVRYMHLGGPAVQSAMRLNAPHALELEYTRAMMSFLFFHPSPRDVCLIGLGGGSIAKFIHRHLRSTRLTALEINPEVVASARGYFQLPPDDGRLRVLTGDGAAFVQDHPRSQDVLMVDGYDAKRIVEDLASPGFYAACRSMLRPNGLALFNLWGSDGSFERYLTGIKAAFAGRVLQLPSERKSNIVVLAFGDPPEPRSEPLDALARTLSADLGLEFPEFLARMRIWNPSGDTGIRL